MSQDFSVDDSDAPAAPVPVDDGGFSPEQHSPESADPFQPGETAGPQQLDDASLDMTAIGAAADPQLGVDAGLVNTVSAMMDEQGLSAQQKAGVLRGYLAARGDAYDTRSVELERTRQSNVQELQSSWGTSFEAHLADAAFALNSAAGSEQAAKDIAGIELASGGILGDDPRMVRLFANLGSRMQHKPDPNGTGPAVQSGSFISPVAAAEQIEALMDDKKFLAAYMHGEHPGHHKSVKQIADLHAAVAAG